MESLIAAIRLVHVAAGTLALFVAPIPMLTAKGGGSHRRWGKVYFWAMAGVAATAIVLAVWKPVVFLALLAVFSFYSAFYGYRARNTTRSEEHTSELQSLAYIVCRLLLEKKNAGQLNRVCGNID